MKYPLFAGMGDDYPRHLEERYERILVKIVELWDKHAVHDYFSELLIDKRGGRKGFPSEVLAELLALREYRELETFRAVERREDAARQLRAMGLQLDREVFLKAFRAGNPEVVDLFIRSGMTLPQQDGAEPLLMAALLSGHTIVAKIVLAAGADPDAKNRIGLTPLLVACGKTTAGYRAIVGDLIAKGATVNVRDPLGNTPLTLALSGGMSDIARLLIAAGANVGVRSPRGETAEELARRIDSPETAELIAMIEAAR
jgi:tankyrase